MDTEAEAHNTERERHSCCMSLAPVTESCERSPGRCTSTWNCLDFILEFVEACPPRARQVGLRCPQPHSGRREVSSTQGDLRGFQRVIRLEFKPRWRHVTEEHAPQTLGDLEDDGRLLTEAARDMTSDSIRSQSLAP